MEYIDNFHPTEANDYNENHKELEEFKKLDRGYNKIYRKVMKDNGKIKKDKIELYSSGSQGSQIRDAETGERYPYIVGSKDEKYFFKVSMSTGECKSINGSTTFYFLSPSNYCFRLNTHLSKEVIEKWNESRELHEKESKNKKARK